MELLRWHFRRHLKAELLFSLLTLREVIIQNILEGVSQANVSVRIHDDSYREYQ